MLGEHDERLTCVFPAERPGSLLRSLFQPAEAGKVNYRSSPAWLGYQKPRLLSKILTNRLKTLSADLWIPGQLSVRSGFVLGLGELPWDW